LRRLGFSLNEPAELDRLLDENIFPDLIQVPFNFLDRRFEKQLIELKSQGVEIHTRSAFLQGLFFVNEDKLPSFFDELKPIISAFKKKTTNTTAALLNFVLQKNYIDKVIVGVETAVQLEENIAAANTNETVDIELPLLNDKILMPANWPKV
jgi:aryl-alcohol dehydrogenase-like predicted oxidoreductase